MSVGVTPSKNQPGGYRTAGSTYLSAMAREVSSWCFEKSAGLTEMHDIKIEVLKTEILQLLSTHGLNALFLVKGVPQLGDDEEVFSLHHAFFDCSSYTLACFNFVPVILGFLLASAPCEVL